jgi:hypothetical protein
MGHIIKTIHPKDQQGLFFSGVLREEKSLTITATARQWTFSYSFNRIK